MLFSFWYETRSNHFEGNFDLDNIAVKYEPSLVRFDLIQIVVIFSFKIFGIHRQASFMRFQNFKNVFGGTYIDLFACPF